MTPVFLDLVGDDRQLVPDGQQSVDVLGMSSALGPAPVRGWGDSSVLCFLCFFLVSDLIKAFMV